MPEWVRTAIGAVIGFLAGRLGSAVDHEMKAQHRIRTAVPALLEAQRATNRALDGIADKLTTMSRSELELRSELAQSRKESAESRAAVTQDLRLMAKRIDRLDQRLDDQGLQGQTCALPYDPHLHSTPAPPGRRSDCQAGHWVPPLDRPDWGSAD